MLINASVKMHIMTPSTLDYIGTLSDYCPTQHGGNLTAGHLLCTSIGVKKTTGATNHY